MNELCSIGTHLMIIGICYYAWQRVLFEKLNINYDVKLIVTSKIELEGSGWGLSMTRVRYKLTNIRKKTKN